MVQEGDRIELVSTSDEYTELTPGDQGTVTGTQMIPAAITGGTPEQQIDVEWDTGISLSLLRGEDKFKILTSNNDNNE